MTLWSENDSCSHTHTEDAVVSVLESGEIEDTISVQRCSNCNVIVGVDGYEEGVYSIQQSLSDPECSHKDRSLDFAEYTFTYKNSSQTVWETTVRRCNMCGSLIERMNIHLLEKPK